jgi:hypothetical protein
MVDFKKTKYVLFILILLFTGISQAQLLESATHEKKIVRFKNNSFFVEIAETRQQQEKGLMFVKDLPPDSGMLFVYKNQESRAFYMKNTYIPLDIIWLNEDKEVVFIKKNAKPESLHGFETIQPQEEAMYVLELNAGSSDKIGLSIGDTWQF